VPSVRAEPSSSSKAAIVAAVAVLLASGTADAFRPTARWIVDQASAKQLARSTRSLTVEQETTLFDREDAPRGLRVSQRTWLLAPGNLRVERELPEGVHVRVWTAKKQLVRKPGAEDLVRRAPPDLMAAFLSAGGATDRALLTDALMKLIERMKVDTEVVSYARFDGRICYLIGSKPWETDKPQVWFDKDTKQLVRVVTARKNGDKVARSEVRLLGYGSPEGGSWFPKTVEYYEGETLVWRAVTRSVDKNKPLDKSLFAVR
jgi:hypothetical protein